MRIRNKKYRGRGLEPLENRLLQSTTYYVSTTGNNNNAGTSVGAAFANLQYAVSKLQAGDTLDVEAGTYAGFIVGWDPAGQGVYGAISGTASAQITIQADPNAAPGSVIVNSRESKTANGIDLEPGCDYITIKGFTVVNGDGSISNEGIKDCGNFTQILDNTVHGVGKTGIFGSFSSHSLVQGNLSYSNGEHGIYWSNSPQFSTIIDNICHDNASGGIQMNADASQGGPGTSQGMNISDNIIYNNGVSGGGALNMDGLQNSIVENNLLFNNHASGLVLYDGDASEGSTGNLVANNTIVMASGARPALNDNTNSSGNIFFNNIFIGDMLVDSTSTPAAWSNNILETGYNNKGDWSFPTGVTSTASALFTDASGTFAQASDYKLSASSLAIGRGIATFDGKSAPTTDLSGITRATRIDDGALELGSTVQVPSIPVTAPPPVITTPPLAPPPPKTVTPPPPPPPPVQTPPPPPPVVNTAPTITQAAVSSSALVGGKTVSLSVGATDAQHQTLTYTWSYSGPANVTYSVNGTSTANHTTANFTRSGVYTFTVTVKDTGGLKITSSVRITVLSMVTTITLAAPTPTFKLNSSVQLTATALDQFNLAVPTQPTFIWSVTGLNRINATGLLLVPSATGNIKVTVLSGKVGTTRTFTIS